MHVVGVHMYMHAYGVQRLALGVFLNKSLSYFLRLGLPLNLNLTGWLRWLASEFQRSSCLHFPALALHKHITAPSFYVDAAHLNSGSHACAAKHFTNWAIFLWPWFILLYPAASFPYPICWTFFSVSHLSKASFGPQTGLGKLHPCFFCP